MSNQKSVDRNARRLSGGPLGAKPESVVGLLSIENHRSKRIVIMFESNPRVSLGLPVYNGENYLAGTDRLVIEADLYEF